MKIFKGKYYKELYEKEKEDNKWLETQLNIRKNKIIELENTIKKLEKEIKLDNSVNKYHKTQIEKLKQDIEKKERLRRKSAGKIGGLTTNNHKLKSEKKEMLNLINKLLEEIRKREKYKPTLKELKEYFKISY